MMHGGERFPRLPLVVMTGFALLTVLAGGFLYGQFEYTEVCRDCGRGREAIDWQIPGSRFTYYTVAEERETSLSAALERHGLAEAHTHRWQLVRGHGNGVEMLLGDGHLAARSLLCPSMGAFVDDMRRWTDEETTRWWVDRLRQPQSALLCQVLADSSRRETFANRAEWESWLAATETRQSLPHRHP